MSNPSQRLAQAAQHDGLINVASYTVNHVLRLPDWMRYLEQAVERMGHAAGARRCFLLEHQEGESGEVVVSCRASWHSSDLPETMAFLTGQSFALDESVCIEWSKRLEIGETLVDLERDLPAQVRDALLLNSAGAIAISPVLAGGRLWGCLGLYDVDPARIWTEAELDTLRLISDTIAAALERDTLEEGNARAAEIVANSEDAIIAKDLDGIVLAWNAGAERLYGYAADEVIGQPITVIFPPDLHDDFPRIMNRLRNGEQLDHYETVRVRKDGSEVAVSISISPISDDSGEVSGAVTIARDITARKQVELLLKSSEERLRLALEAGNVGAWDWHVPSGEVVWSPNMERLHGLEPGSFGETFEDFKSQVHPDDRDLVLAAIQNALDERGDYSIEYRSALPDGSHKWLSAQGQVIEDERGRAVRMTGVCTDVTERKRAEQMQTTLLTQIRTAHAAAEAERARLREMFQHAPAMMALLEGPNHVFTFANDHYERSVGYRDLIGRPVRDALPELEGQGLYEMLDYAFESGEPVVRSELPVELDGLGDGNIELRYFSFAFQPVRDSERHINGILIHAMDLTDHVRARQRIEQLARAAASERDRLQQLIDVLPEGVAITDETGQFVQVNDVALEIWGRSAPDGGVHAYGAFECYRPDGTPYPPEELPLARSILSGESVLMEQLDIRNATTGKLTPVLINSVPLRDTDGRIVGGVAVFQDITTLKEFEQQKDEFLQAVSHDLKNPLTSIQGYAQLLQRPGRDDPERQRTAIGYMETAAKRAIALLDQILDLTRMQMGRPLELTRSEVDLVSVAQRLADQHQATTDRHTIRVDAAVPELIAEWDVVRLERVFDNLITNAVLYSPDGGDVTIRVEQQIDGDESFAITHVEDEGIGIPASDLPHLFERFWRGSNAQELIRGTGLGLAGVKVIVEAHGGEISVESVEGKGSTFSVRLPMVHRAPDDE